MAEGEIVADPARVPHWCVKCEDFWECAGCEDGFPLADVICPACAAAPSEPAR